ncbi:hypothetical protein, partial [uncultured Dubosiella sp.]|uniref:hypothetical protein n=1 Tax=uncultured Dubosiella sp. TaxID=1937011 RepID=UPI00272F52E9
MTTLFSGSATSHFFAVLKNNSTQPGGIQLYFFFFSKETGMDTGSYKKFVTLEKSLSFGDV